MAILPVMKMKKKIHTPAILFVPIIRDAFLYDRKRKLKKQGEG